MSVLAAPPPSEDSVVNVLMFKRRTHTHVSLGLSPGKSRDRVIGVPVLGGFCVSVCVVCVGGAP